MSNTFPFSRILYCLTFTLFVVFLSSLGITCDEGNCENGYGVATYRGGDNWTLTVEGEFVNGEFVKGKATFSDTGDVWEGTFKSGIPEGQGTLTVKNGDKIFCDFVKGTCPKGKRVYSNGNQYEGEFKDGDADIKNGKGILTYVDGSRYEGTWKNNKLDGPGTYIKADKTVYAQNFNNGELVSEKKAANSNNKKTAKCIKPNPKLQKMGIEIIPPEGLCLSSHPVLKEIFEGEDCENGRGTKVLCNGLIYTGNFKDSLFHGKGTFKPSLRRGDRIHCNSIEGACTRGTISYRNGSRYEGEIKNYKRHGKGKYVYYEKSSKTRTVFKVKFKDDKKHGVGILIKPNGTAYKAEWENDKLVKELEEIKTTQSNATAGDPKKYWEGALNCYKFTDNPAKESQRGYVDELVNSVEIYKSSNSSSAKNDIFMYSNMIVQNLGCSKDLFN